ncbi:glycoside hydrolase family 93 protein [Pyrenophora tritici-repentis]|uniref:CENP-Q multi-domain protein n=1 Tax=Pyrenophora tritici-repentis TaxID=45151 RepID=A0A2W1DPH8_9PLEO|nr:CENP-Q multi-domain protein [Pyrenophora tritici-repentis]KAF7449778.1 CENP-Q multi-domain protein [Pyrenophora tritici-repentis]KAF7570095.1 CENP-Q multi-domain protein [Pyrenophora tritici-repentis]KAG9383293.1 CENP-Q multi-domain protein [Pyrenophora tritici-repentis]KAI1509983.1 CENP-Q multi-domain protein [Pyrenophora tritici-repentis]
MAPKRSSDNKVKKGRGRPPGSRNSKGVSKPAPKPVAKPIAKPTTKKPKPRRKEIQEETEDELSLADAAPSQASKPRKRKADAIAEAEPKSRKQYAQLEVRTKKIPQEQIDTWPQVSAQVLEQMTTVIRNAKKDIAETQRDERRIMAAHNALNPLVRRLSRQLAASRIPPQAKDIHFNIDKLTERNAQVSRQVTTARHAKQLLSEQVNVAQHLLKKEEENLEELKKNAKKWRTEWKHQKKHGRLHPLLDDDGDEANMDGDGPDDIGLKSSEPVDASRLDAADNHLAPVLEQLRRSLENMQGNHAQVEGLDTAMGAARAALDDMLFRHANAAQYAGF